jgi:hypothetical protein
MCHTYIVQYISGSERYLFDIYTNENPDAREAVGITDGIAAVDGTGPKQARRKRHREWRFPFELIQKALETRPGVWNGGGLKPSE